MLRAFCAIRNALTTPDFQRTPRRIRGQLNVSATLLSDLKSLQDAGRIESIFKDGKNCSYLPDVIDQTVTISLNPDGIGYYDDLHDLLAFTIEEPAVYYVHGIGDVAAGVETPNASIKSYRQMLKARQILRDTADYPDVGKVVFLTPDKIEIPLAYAESSIPPLRHLDDLQNQFAKRPEKDPADFDQRLVLFRKSIREYLKTQPPEDRFGLFLRNFETIYDSYNRDYQLWIGNTFGELEKSFEEKRLKFVTDLNGILAGVQASLLSVPITAILLGDKYDLSNPLKDFLLWIGVLAVAGIAFRLLQNQTATLDATRAAIDATKQDFEKKHTKRRAEFQTRLQSLDEQERRVRTLLGFIRNIIVLIVIAGLIGWLAAVFHTPPRNQKAAHISLATNMTCQTSSNVLAAGGS